PNLRNAAARAIFAAAVLIGVPQPASGAPWLFVSDVHYDPFVSSTSLAPYGKDTNGALLTSALVQMRRADPDPPVVVLAGDLLAHHLAPAAAAATMRELARRFDATFPKAQFVLALGNNDNACGDYETQPRAAFLRDVATAWEPLVNRRGAAPAFARDFAADGSYATTLPLPSLRAIVIDDVFWSIRYRNACENSPGDPGAQLQAHLQALLDDSAARTWIVAHIPPGIDAYSTTQLAHQIIVVPFLQDGAQTRWLQTLRKHPVTLLVDGHSHRFAFRTIAGGPNAIPVLLVPAISPVYGNNPSFLVADVKPDGVAGAPREFALDEHTGVWAEIGRFDVAAFTSDALEGYAHRLETQPALRASFARLYDGAATRPEITEANWRAYWCAARALDVPAYRACTAAGASGTWRWPPWLLLGAIAAVSLAGSIPQFAATARRRIAATPRAPSHDPSHRDSD
ncbi:MAG: metallophosphoesterase, partial [Candidatus Eremiobacteraeota bacterium]|nr:metallophosphoesterase [Candidatus Eremiobacteraeota bacterium]